MLQNTDGSLKGKFDSIIFDLDGTLWDSTANVAVAWEKAREQVDYVNNPFTVERVRAITGMPYDAIFEVLLPELDNEKRESFKAICAKSEIDTLHAIGGDMYPGLEETMNYLAQHYQLYIVSNCQNGYIETFFKHSPVSHLFLGYQCYGTKGLPKSENIKDIVNDHSLKAPVYVGDTMGDYDAAKKAGVPFIFASYGFGKVEEGQIATISKFAELLQLL